MARYRRCDPRFLLASVTMSSFLPQSQIQFTTSVTAFHGWRCSLLTCQITDV